MKKLLFVIDSLSGGGAEQVICTLANEAKIQGHAVDVLLTFANTVKYELNEGVGLFDIYGKEIPHTKTETVQKSKTSQSHENESHKDGLIRKIRAKISEFRDVKRRVKLLQHFVNQNNYDGVISFLTNSNELVGRAAKYLNAKTIVSERASPQATIMLQKSSRQIYSLYKNVDWVVFQTEEAKRYYPAKIQKKGFIIPNPIKKDLPEPYVGERGKEIVGFGRLIECKNWPMLIEAFSKVHKLHSEYKLKIYGDGVLREELIELIEHLHLSEYVDICEFQTDIHEKVKKASIYVSSSNYEGISNSMLEAMAIGLPCVCTDCPVGGAKMFIKNDINGILVPVGDVEVLANALIRIIENESHAHSLGAEAIKIREKLSADAILKQWIKLL